MIIGSTQNMFLDMRILSRAWSVLDPDADGKLLRQAVLQHIVRHDRGRVHAVKLEDLVSLSTLVSGKGGCPGGRGSRCGQQIHAVARGSAQFPLAANAVGVAIATLADVIGGQSQGGAHVAQDARCVTEVKPRRGQQRLRTDAGGVIYPLGDASPSGSAYAIHLDRHHRRRRLFHAAIVSDYAEDVVVRAFVVQRLGVADGTLVVDDEWLVGGEDLVLADIAEFRRAVTVGRLDANHLLVEATLVHGANIGRLEELRRVLVDVNHGNMNRGAEIKLKCARASQGLSILLRR